MKSVRQRWAVPTLRERSGCASLRRWPERARAAAAAFGAEIGRCAEVVAAFGALAALQVPETLALWQLSGQEQHT